MTDLHDLLLLCQTGDSAAYDLLYELVRPKLIGAILKLAGSILDESDAEDAFQSAMVNVYLRATQYQGENSYTAMAWMRSIACRQALKVAKSQKKHFSRNESLDNNDDEDDSAVYERNSMMSDLDWEGEKSVEGRVIRSNIFEAIKEYLSEEDLELLRMRYEEELNFEEIGKRIERTKARAKQRHDGIIAKIISFL